MRARSLRSVTLHLLLLCGAVTLVFLLWQPLLAN